MALLAASVASEKKELAFVFELVRHGARAPLISEDDGIFSVDAGILTPSGMRERYLLGTRNRARYIENNKLLNPEYVES